jgi:ribosomal protein S18 acetylase RimI-like enzyme
MLRAITTSDIDTIILCLLRLHAESPKYNKVIPDVPFVSDNLRAMIEHPNFIGTIATDNAGFMFGASGQQWFDPELNAYEQLLYILPDRRGGSLAARLIRSFEALSRARGCVHVHAGTSTLVNTEQTLKLYEALGYTRDGTGVFKRIN